MTKSLRIALVYDAVYPYAKGGGERRFFELGSRLAAKGHSVDWYGMQYWDDGDGPVANKGIAMHGLCQAKPLYNQAGKRQIGQALIFGLSAFKLIGKNFDVLDCCGFPYFSLFPAKIATLLRRKPLYATWHEVWGKAYWNEYLGALGFVGATVEWLAARLPNVIIVPSQHVADNLQRQLGVPARKIKVVPNGVDLASLRTVKASKKAAMQTDLVYAGRIIEHKGLDLLLDSLALLNKRGRRVSLSVVGDGPALSDLRAKALDLGLDDQVHWHGFLPEANDVYVAIKAAKVFVLPSKREGFGIVVIEANALGVPVLTADYPDNAAKDLIDDGVNGLVFKPAAEDLADAVVDALRVGVLKEMRVGSLDFAADFDWEILTDETAAVYRVYS